MWIVTDARTAVAFMVRSSTRAVIYSVDVIQGKRPKWAGCLTHREVELVLPGECTSLWVLTKSQHDLEPALSRLIKVATRIGRQRAKDAGGAIDLGRIIIKRVEGCHTQQ